MKIQYISLIFALLTLLSCEKEEPEFTNTGSFTFGSTKQTILNARYQLDSVNNDIHYSHLTFSSNAIKISDAGISGGGASYLKLSLQSQSRELEQGDYAVGSTPQSLTPYTSYVETISEDKKDTTRTLIASGTMNYSLQGDTMPNFSFDFKTTSDETITGSYLGTLTQNYIVNTDSAGYYQRDTVLVPLGSAIMWNWGNLFDDNTHYYEIELHSTNMRINDAGKVKSGNVLYLGLFSTNISYPSDGEYVVGEGTDNLTLFYGHKINNTYWGTYWQELRNTSIASRANVVSGSITITTTKTGKSTITINLKDQLNKKIQGEYSGTITAHRQQPNKI